MDAQLAGIADVRGGVFCTADAAACGYDRRGVKARVASGEWAWIRPGWYSAGARWSAADAVERHRLRSRAVLLPLEGREAGSHTTAAVHHDLDLLDPDLAHVHSTIVGNGKGRTAGGVVHHQGPLRDEDLVLVRGVWVTALPVTVLATMLLSGRRGALVVGNSALHRRLVSRHELDEIASSWLRRPGMRQVRHWLGLLDPGCASPLETIGLDVLRVAPGIPLPVTQFRVDLPEGGYAVADVAWERERVLGEFDGRRKYERDLRPGERPGDAVFREKKREDRLRDLGWEVVRFTWADLHRPDVLVRRVATALERGRRRAS